ncbi:SUF system Fe-S cluster assembly regulator [Azospirillum doebereinerae]
MIRLSKLTDYAIVVLSEMARHTGVVHTVSVLAERTGVPAPTVAKLMKALTPAGLTTSQRGAAGGYALNRPADAISIAEIITALDGPIALTACVDGAESQCGVERLCPMRGGWEKVNRAIRDALEQVSLADMMTPILFPDPAAAPAHAVDAPAARPAH